MTPPKLLFLVTEDWYFCSHRLPVARAARRAGFEVVVATRVNRHGELIRNEGFSVCDLRLCRGSLNPWRELKSLREIIGVYLREKPSIVHHVALKPVLYGSIAAYFAKPGVVVNALAGLGSAFASKSMLSACLRLGIKAALKRLLVGSGRCVVVQHDADQDFLRSLRVPDASVTVIPGSGVDMHTFQPSQPPEGEIVVTMVSRMLWHKGVGEFVGAARLLRTWGLNVRFWLVGDPDPENPASISNRQIDAWKSEDIVTLMGERPDVPAVWAASHIAVLPSFYREGVPKSLIEAAACARPIVATNGPGCRDVVVHGKTGYLVPERDVSTLAATIRRLVEDRDLCLRLGRAAREHVEQRFSAERVAGQTMQVYASMLAKGCLR